MSGTVTDDDAPEMLAAEYVLGTLDWAERLACEARRAAEPEFAAELRFWETRLYPLTALVPPVTPPEAVWTRIESSVAGGAAVSPGTPARVPAANDNRVGRWRAAALASMAVAAGLALFIAVRPAPAPLFAVLMPAGSKAGVLLAVAGHPGALLVRANGTITVAGDRDLELWALPAGASRPASLGVLPAGGTTVTTRLAAGTQLLVSVEPKGGSPTGQPTGQVVYGGVMQRAD